MAKKIKHVSELPTWFQLEKYEFTKTLDALGWYQQLIIRNVSLYAIVEHLENKEAYPEGLLLALTEIRGNPNCNIMRENNYANFFPNRPIAELMNPQTHTRDLLGIYPITLSRYISSRNFIDKQRLADAEKWLNSSPTDKEEFLKNAPWLNEPLDKSYLPGNHPSTDILIVDLARPDSFLIESFKKYLENQRKIAPKEKIIPKHFRESDFNHWSKLNILAYFDLLLLEYQMQKRITNRVYADAIYPLGEKGEETIRKTTHPLICQLTRFHVLNQLSTQAAHEISEKNMN